jgi:hypothetical protein
MAVLNFKLFHKESKSRAPQFTVWFPKDMPKYLPPTEISSETVAKKPVVSKEFPKKKEGVLGKGSSTAPIRREQQALNSEAAVREAVKEPKLQKDGEEQEQLRATPSGKEKEQKAAEVLEEEAPNLQPLTITASLPNVLPENLPPLSTLTGKGSPLLEDLPEEPQPLTTVIPKLKEEKTKEPEEEKEREEASPTPEDDFWELPPHSKNH